MWHCDIANVRKIDYGTLTPSLLPLNLVGKLWCCDAHKFQGPILHSPNRSPSARFLLCWLMTVYFNCKYFRYRDFSLRAKSLRGNNYTDDVFFQGLRHFDWYVDRSGLYNRHDYMFHASRLEERITCYLSFWKHASKKPRISRLGQSIKPIIDDNW